MTTPEDKLQRLLLLAQSNRPNRETASDIAEQGDFTDFQSFSGGNFDDCYMMGSDDGATEMARAIIKIING